jgi:hypothetical protein
MYAGVYQHRVTVPGLHHYWSGFADENELISFRGRLDVQPRASHLGQVRVKVAGFEADYHTTSSELELHMSLALKYYVVYNMYLCCMITMSVYADIRCRNN